MINIVNLDSSVNVCISRKKIDKIYTDLKIISPLLQKIPVYLVKESTMDKLYPLEKRLTLSKNCIKRVMNRVYEEFEAIEITEDEFLNKVDNFVEECLRERIGNHSIVGLYLSYIPDEIIEEFQIKQMPSVFICVERCVEWAGVKNVEADIVFRKVLYHEFAHAYMDSGNYTYYKTWWGKVIEESIANFITLTRFTEKEEQGQVIQLILDQPLEYIGGLVMLDKPLGVHAVKFLNKIYEYLYYNDILPYRPWIKYSHMLFNALEILPAIWKEWKESRLKIHQNIFKLYAFYLIGVVVN